MKSNVFKIGDTVLVDVWPVEVWSNSHPGKHPNNILSLPMQYRTLKNRSLNSNQIKQQLSNIDGVKPNYFEGYKELSSFFLNNHVDQAKINPENFNVGIVTGFWPEADFNSSEVQFVQILLNDAAYWMSAEILQFLKVKNNEK